MSMYPTLLKELEPGLLVLPRNCATQEYIIEQFEAMGYEVEIQPFSFERRGTTYGSENIIATKPGKLEQTVILGAHYDSVPERTCADGNVGAGAGDNASGVGVMLEVAEVLANYKTKAAD